MSRAVLIVIAVLLLLGLAGGGVMGWMYMSRDRVAVATYRVQLPKDISMNQLISKEKEMMKSDEVLIPVVKTLDLVERWKLESEDEALARLRAKLLVREDVVNDRVRVIYRDRNQDRALEILEEINKVFAKVRFEAARKMSMPPVIPLDEGETLEGR